MTIPNFKPAVVVDKPAALPNTSPANDVAVTIPKLKLAPFVTLLAVPVTSPTKPVDVTTPTVKFVVVFANPVAAP